MKFDSHSILNIIWKPSMEKNNLLDCFFIIKKVILKYIKEIDKEV